MTQKVKFLMKKNTLLCLITLTVLFSCGGKTTKKRNLDNALFKYAALIRWSDFDNALRYIKPGDDKSKPSNFELQHLKQFKVSRYKESPISPGNKENEIIQNVEIQLYNIHNNRERVISDRQIWQFDDELKQWFLTSGLPKL